MLSGRKLEDMIAGAGEERRTLERQDEKKNSFDFALWKKADKSHIMQWPSPWGNGFPGWHLECSAMSKKYLGERFDIHFGGMDLLFPHHECEIAQCQAAHKQHPVNYWLHNNMITINGKKMARSLNNGILVNELYKGNNALLEKPFDPMVLRFFLLQAHYRSTIDFSNEALKAAEKGYDRLVKTYNLLIHETQSAENSVHKINFEEWEKNLFDAFAEDLNTPMVLALLFEAAKWINQIIIGKWQLNETDLERLKKIYILFFGELLGLQVKELEQIKNSKEKEIMGILIEIRKNAKEHKNYALADEIRTELEQEGIKLIDTKSGTSYEIS